MTSAGSYVSVSGAPGIIIVPAEREGDIEKTTTTTTKMQFPVELNPGNAFLWTYFRPENEICE